MFNVGKLHADGMEMDSKKQLKKLFLNVHLSVVKCFPLFSDILYTYHYCFFTKQK